MAQHFKGALGENKGHCNLAMFSAYFDMWVFENWNTLKLCQNTNFVYLKRCNTEKQSEKQLKIARIHQVLWPTQTNKQKR